MKVALSQSNFHVGNFYKNLEKIKNQIIQSKVLGIDLIAFPELALMGYPPLDLLSYSGVLNNIEKCIEELLPHTENIMVLIGLPSRNNKKGEKPYFNSVFALYNGSVVYKCHKTLLPSYDIFDEDRFFQKNEAFDILEFKGLRIAISICEDLWYDKVMSYKDDPIQKLKDLSPDFMINISASPFDINKMGERFDLVKSAALKMNIPIFYVNQVGGNTDILFDGGSMVVDKTGALCDFAPTFKEYLLVSETSNLIQKNKPTIPRERSLIGALVMGIRDYCQKTGFNQIILGLSGGIDSALVAVLAVKAMGAENVRVLLMPSEFSSEHSVLDSIALSENLGIKYDLVSIKEAYNQTLESLNELFENKEFNVAEENIQSRHRGLILMAMSNKHGYILLNTTNKSEMAVGYGTLYGDMCGGISVLGDVYKTDVYKICNYINRNNEIIPSNIINKPPSAELRPDQKDSDSLPAYEVLDKILYEYIEQKKSKNELGDIFGELIVEKVIGLVNIAEYKRYQAPPVLRVSSKAFGMGRQVPIVAKFDF